MAGCRYALATCSYITNVVIPNQKQLCVFRSRHQPYSVIKSPREIYKQPEIIRRMISSNYYVSSTDNGAYEWKDTVMLITGASKGIGSEVVRTALKEGVKYITNLDIDESAGLALKYELNQRYNDEKLNYIYCDVSDDKQLIDCFESVLGNKNETYVVINNAGILNDSMYKKEIDINVGALVTGSLTALELMRKDKGGQGGAIINISSVAALCPLPVTPIYNATKSAVLTFSIGLGNEQFYSRTGVRVMTICFGATETGLIEMTNMGSFDKEIENKFGMALQTYPGQRADSAARGVIDIFKKGESGSTWLANANKPAEDITYIVRKAYSLLTEPIFML